MSTPIEPHIWVNDLQQSIDWYRKSLGFEVRQWFPSESDPSWVQMGRGEALLMLASEPASDGYLADVRRRLDGPGPAMSLYLHVDDSDTAHEQASRAGARVIEPIWDAWWGGRQFTLADPDDNWWTVFQSQTSVASE